MSDDPKTWREAAYICLREIYSTGAIGSEAELEEVYNRLNGGDDLPVILDLGYRAWEMLMQEGLLWSTAMAADLLERKQSDYGSANIMRFGLDGLKVRLWDKIARYNNLTRQDAADVRNESIEDTLKDIVGYCTLWLMVHHDWMELPLKEPQETESPWDSLETISERPFVLHAVGLYNGVSVLVAKAVPPEDILPS